MSVYLVHNVETTQDQAITWALRLQGETMSIEDGLDVDAWLEASPANSEALAQVLSVLETYDAAGPDVLQGLKRSEQIAARRLAKGWWSSGAGISGIAAALALAFVVIGQGSLFAQTSNFATKNGEHRSVKLADGSTIDMNSETGMAVRLTSHERHVTMGQGEAIFDVAHDAARPFEIQAGGHIVHVLGTQFDVRNRPEGFSVIVSRGVVQVRGDGPTVILRKGERLDFAPGEASKVSTTDPAEALGWRTGRLIFRDQPLSGVVADLNRQFPEKIQIGDEHLAQEKISGVLVLDNQNLVLERLALMLPLKTVRSDQGVVLQSKSSPF